MDLNSGGIQCIQHTIGGTGTFTGVSLGYARASLTNGGTTIYFRSRLAGTAGNSLKVQLVDPRPSPCPSTYAVMVDENTLNVFLATNADGSSITGTSASVVAAIHAIRKRCPIAAKQTGSGVMAASSLTSFAGGLDSSDVGGVATTSVATTVCGGLFFFDQYLALRVLQIEGKMSGAGNVRVNLVSIDEALRPVTDSEVTIYEAALGTNHDFFLPNQSIVLMPSQAIQVIANLQGYVRVYNHRDDDLG